MDNKNLNMNMDWDGINTLNKLVARERMSMHEIAWSSVDFAWNHLEGFAGYIKTNPIKKNPKKDGFAIRSLKFPSIAPDILSKIISKLVDLGVVIKTFSELFRYVIRYYELEYKKTDNKADEIKSIIELIGGKIISYTKKGKFKVDKYPENLAIGDIRAKYNDFRKILSNILNEALDEYYKLGTGEPEDILFINDDEKQYPYDPTTANDIYKVLDKLTVDELIECGEIIAKKEDAEEQKEFNKEIVRICKATGNEQISLWRSDIAHKAYKILEDMTEEKILKMFDVTNSSIIKTNEDVPAFAAHLNNRNVIIIPSVAANPLEMIEAAAFMTLEKECPGTGCMKMDYDGEFYTDKNVDINVMETFSLFMAPLRYLWAYRIIKKRAPDVYNRIMTMICDYLKEDVIDEDDLPMLIDISLARFAPGNIWKKIPPIVKLVISGKSCFVNDELNSLGNILTKMSAPEPIRLVEYAYYGSCPVKANLDKFDFINLSVSDQSHYEDEEEEE